jgi:hypothetical protein
MQRKHVVTIGLILAASVLSAIALGPQSGSLRLAGGTVRPAIDGIAAAQAPEPHAPQVLLGTGFTYQGLLKKNNLLVNDNACSMSFSLWDSQSNLSGQVGSSQPVNPVAVANGLFKVVLNGAGQFGLAAFDGSDRWLQAAVQCTGDGGPVTLSRQPLTAAPYAFALPGLWVQRNAISPNLIGGFSANTINAASSGSVIGGGGSAGRPIRSMAATA